MSLSTSDEKFRRVLSKNTWFFFNADFEENHEAEIVTAISTLLYNVYEDIKQNRDKRDIFDALLQKPLGLRAALALNGFSTEILKRLMTFARIVSDPDLDTLLLRSQWSIHDDEAIEIAEWGTLDFEARVRNDAALRRGIINLLFDGASNPILSKTLSPFELKKLSVTKFSFEIAPMIDTLVRYKVKGAYSAAKENNAETIIRRALDEMGVSYTQGKLTGIAGAQNRTMDFIIPDKENPLLILECSYVVTTSSGLGDKAKAEITMRSLIKETYPGARFFGFIDGIGWYVRAADLHRMVEAFDDVFTLHPDELARFRTVLETLQP